MLLIESNGRYASIFRSECVEFSDWIHWGNLGMVFDFQHAIALEWAFWLDFQGSAFYLLILYCLVQRCVLKTGAMVFTDVLESPKINKIWWGISYPNGYLLWAYGISHNKEEDFPWGKGFVFDVDNQLVWLCNPNTCTGLPYNLCR